MAVRYYHLGQNREAWGTSIVIHAWLLALLLFVPALKIQAEEPLSPPLELVALDLGPLGDTLEAAHDRPAPKPAQVARVRPVPPQQKPVSEPKPAGEKPAKIAAVVPGTAPRIEQVSEPDAAVLAAEDARRKAGEEARRKEIEAGGYQVAHSGTGTGDLPPPGGAVSTGRGLTGDLSGRRVLDAVEPDYPSASLERGATGAVRVQIRVAPNGQVVEARITRSSGDPDLDAAALAAFRQWRFSPIRDESHQVDQVGETKMTFTIPRR